jgi:hypothetical protein
MARSDEANSQHTDEIAIEFDRFGLRSNFDGVGESARSASRWMFDDRRGARSGSCSGSDKSDVRGLNRSINERLR